MIEYSIRGEILSTAGPDLQSLGVSAIGVCPTCGTPWFRLHVEDRDWRAFTVACPECPPWPFDTSIPGSILPVTGLDALAHLPDAVLKHEFLMHLAFWERKNHESEVEA